MIHYKYYTCNPNLIDTLENNHLFFQDPNNFNDPFEFPIHMIYDGNPSVFISWANECDIKKGNDFSNPSSVTATIKTLIAANKLNEFTNIINSKDELARERIETMNDYLVTCFTNKNKSPLMWAHYTDKHKGLCLGFELFEHKNNIFFGFEENYFQESLPFIINGKLFPMKKVIYNEIYPEPINRFDPGFAKKAGDLIFVKQIDWKYEQELRIAFNKNWLKDKYRLSNCFKFSKDILKTIDFGINFDVSKIDSIITLCKRNYPSAKLRRCIKSDSQYDIEFVDL
jgi:hypothetical protein